MTIHTVTSPTAGGILPTGITAAGGIVVDMIGISGVRVVAQVPASELFKGYFSTGTPAAYQGNPGTAGILPGLSPADIAALGGGISEMAVRITLYDGDNAAGDVDYRHNSFLVNGIDIGDMSDVATEATNATGQVGFGSTLGFADRKISTGWFLISDTGALGDIHTGLLGTGKLTFQVADTDAYDNDFDFRQGSDGNLVLVGVPSNTAPVVNAESYTVDVNSFRFDVDAAHGVLANDSDPEGAPLIATMIRDAGYGSVTLFDDGSFTYYPDANFKGTDSFTYAAYDGGLMTEQVVTFKVQRPSSGISATGTKGDDTLNGTTRSDQIRAKAGDDIINAGAGNDFVTGDAGNDTVTAGKGDDRVDGNDGDDLLYGRDGDDVLLGGQGSDGIMGDAGNDHIHGQAGDDLLSGGDGFDIFYFSWADGKDRITDFDAGDQLNLVAAGLDFADLAITSDAAGTTIAFGATTIFLKGVGSVSVSDFIF